MTAAAISTSGHLGLGHSSGSAMSGTAEYIRSIFSDLKRHRSRTAVAQSTEIETLNKLDALYSDYRVENWGGDDEAPVSFGALLDAKKLIELLPTKYRSPDLIPEPTGAIALEWRYSRFRLLIISLSGNGRIEYAGFKGEQTQFHGALPFAGVFPELIYLHLNDVSRGG